MLPIGSILPSGVPFIMAGKKPTPATFMIAEKGADLIRQRKPGD